MVSHPQPGMDYEAQQKLPTTLQGNMRASMNEENKIYYPIRSDRNYELSVVPARQDTPRDFTHGTMSGYTGDGPINKGIPAILHEDQAVLSVEQQRKLRSKWGLNWRMRLNRMAGPGHVVDPIPLAEKVAKSEPVILHGKEMVLSPAESKYIARVMPGLFKKPGKKS